VAYKFGRVFINVTIRLTQFYTEEVFHITVLTMLRNNILFTAVQYTAGNHIFNESCLPVCNYATHQTVHLNVGYFSLQMAYDG
jgi:hypothetical protein